MSRWPGLRGMMSRKAMSVGVERTMKAAGDVRSGSMASGGVRGLYGLNVAAMAQKGHCDKGGAADGSNLARQRSSLVKRQTVDDGEGCEPGDGVGDEEFWC